MTRKALIRIGMLGALAVALGGCDFRAAPDYYGYIRQPSYPDYGGYLAYPANRGYPRYDTYYAPPVPPGFDDAIWHGPL
jgi:hypothetical protein